MATHLWTLALPAVFAPALPVGLMLWWKKRTGVRLWCFAAGAVCFTLFAMVLEQMLHWAVLVYDSPLSRTVTGSPVLYTLYACLAAGLFEETGRFFAFRALLKKDREKSCAVACGIGHGGMEAVLVLGTTYLVYLLAKLGVVFGTPEVQQTLLDAADSIPLTSTLIAMGERVSALMAHIGLSMLVCTAVRCKGKGWLYPAAVVCHGLLDLPAALYQFGVLTSVAVVEALALACGVAYLLLGRWALYGGWSAEEQA